MILPQITFDDLYTAVYTILDDAKARHQVVKLYKGSHPSPDPHPSVLDVGSFLFSQCRGLFAYACSKVSDAEPHVGDLDVFDARHHPRLPTRAAFDLLDGALRREGETSDGYLRYLVNRRHQLGAYRGGSTGLDDESRAFAAVHFRQQGIPTGLDDVQVFSGGAKGAFIAFCAALMCTRDHDNLAHTGGQILAPEGYYQSLRLIPPIFGGDIAVTPDLTGPAVTGWLEDTVDRQGRAVYVPLVNNANGRVLSRQRACYIAEAVLEHNTAHPDNPVYVLGDDVYVGSYLAPGLTPQPISAITGDDLGDPALGRMSDWCATIVTPSKTFALPTSRVAFVTTTNPRLRAAMAHYRTVHSFGRVPQAGELTGVAAMALTPQAWIDEWNDRCRVKLAWLTHEVARVNRKVGFEAYRVDMPEGGWYACLRVSERLFPPGSVTSSFEAFAVLLTMGIGLLPGELFGYGLAGQAGGMFTLRGNIGVSDDELNRLVSWLRHAALLLVGGDGPRIVQHALTSARKVADIDAIMQHRRY